MSLEKSTAIVLRVVEFSETSYVVTLFTRDFGKIGAIAKGAKRPKSPFESALDLLSVCRIVFLHKTSEALDVLTEARLERRFRAGTRDLSRLYAGYYVAELLLELTDEADPHVDLFDAAEATLRELDDPPTPVVAGQAEVAPLAFPEDSTARRPDVESLVLRFELLALRSLGHLPSFTVCSACGSPIAGGARVSFGLLAGGALCIGCRAGQRRVMSVSRSVMDALERFAEESNAWREGIPVQVRGELRAVMNHFVSHLMGRRPRLHAWLSMLSA